MLVTNFRLLKMNGACKERYRALAKALGGIKRYGEDTPITISQILDICGIDDALWALRACPESERFSILLACNYAEHALRCFELAYPDNPIPQRIMKAMRRIIETMRRYAKGEVELNENDLSKMWLKMQDAVSYHLNAILSPLVIVISKLCHLKINIHTLAIDARNVIPDHWENEKQWQEQCFREMLLQE